MQKLMVVRVKLTDLDQQINAFNLKGVGGPARKADLEVQARGYLENAQLPERYRSVVAGTRKAPSRKADRAASRRARGEGPGKGARDDQQRDLPRAGTAQSRTRTGHRDARPRSCRSGEGLSGFSRRLWRGRSLMFFAGRQFSLPWSFNRAGQRHCSGLAGRGRASLVDSMNESLQTSATRPLRSGCPALRAINLLRPARWRPASPGRPD